MRLKKSKNSVSQILVPTIKCTLKTALIFKHGRKVPMVQVAPLQFLKTILLLSPHKTVLKRKKQLNSIFLKTPLKLQ